MISASITGKIIQGFEHALAGSVILTAFIPMLMDTGGKFRPARLPNYSGFVTR